jgi:hypothetical protein
MSASSNGAPKPALAAAGITPIGRKCTKPRGVRMATIHLHGTTTSTPEQLLAALIDFGPGRSKVFRKARTNTSRCMTTAPPGFGCHTIVKNRDYVFTDYGPR